MQVRPQPEIQRHPFNDQPMAPPNQATSVLPNRSKIFSPPANNGNEAEPPVDQRLTPAGAGDNEANADQHTSESIAPQRQEFDRNIDGWSVPHPASPANAGSVATRNQNAVQPRGQEVKSPAGLWGAVPNHSLQEANRAMEEDFLRSMGQNDAAPADSKNTFPSTGESPPAVNNGTQQSLGLAIPSFAPQNRGNAAGANLAKPIPVPDPMPPAQQPAQQGWRTQTQDNATQDKALPLVIPGFSDRPPNGVPPTRVTPVPQQNQNTPTHSHGSPDQSLGIPMQTYETEGQLDQPPPSFPQHPAPFNAPIDQQQPQDRQIPPSVVLPNQGGHSFPELLPPMEQQSPAFAAGAHSGQGSFPGLSGYRATGESDAPAWMSPYEQRASVADSGSIIAAIRNLPPLPPGFSPWWDDDVRQSTGPGGASIPVDVGNLLQDALLYSPQVNAIKAEPEVQYRVITQEAAKFDWTAFLETTYDDLNDPVGNTLTTATGEDRLLTRKFRGSGGVRRKNLNGGEFQVAQNIGHENQTSSFFIPNNQGTSRLEVSYRQPLLDGAGEAYNRSEIILASIAANSSEDEVVAALQEHLIEVTEAYWALYRARAEFFQRQKLLSSANDVLIRLEGRSEVDTIPRQILRSRAAVARAQTRIQRTLARVEDAESQLRLLVNSPAMLTGGPIEVLPLEAPNMVTENADLQSVLQTALANRPDISEAIRKMRASTVRLGVSKKELLPRLDFLVESYVSDLSGNSDVGRALQGQFTDNRPGYTVGFELEIPLENRAAIAKLEQRQWELKRSMNAFRATVEKSLTDTEVARREVATAYSEIVSRYHSMMAADQESRYLADRFTVLPASEDSATLLLEDLLDSFERLADEESSFVQAQVDHAVALVRLKEEMGVLLKSRNARPDVEQDQQTYMSDRLQASSSRTKANGATSSIAEPTQMSPSGGRSGSSNKNIRVVGHQLGGPPVAGYTTTWKRPEVKNASQSRTVPVSGHSKQQQ